MFISHTNFLGALQNYNKIILYFLKQKQTNKQTKKKERIKNKTSQLRVFTMNYDIERFTYYKIIEKYNYFGFRYATNKHTHN